MLASINIFTRQSEDIIKLLRIIAHQVSLYSVTLDLSNTCTSFNMFYEQGFASSTFCEKRYNFSLIETISVYKTY